MADSVTDCRRWSKWFADARPRNSQIRTSVSISIPAPTAKLSDVGVDIVDIVAIVPDTAYWQLYGLRSARFFPVRDSD